MITIEGDREEHDSAANLEWARETERRLREAGGSGAYAGFAGVEEQAREDWTEQVYADSYDRLAAIEREYDPENVLRHNVNVDPRVAAETPADDDRPALPAPSPRAGTVRHTSPPNA
ncbi:hypothetical protein BRD13_08440 [Halobacteriales archaeon SW_5_70_135]|nr:MAG: hypothetical protein BRD13_08440 [Halobacteriales archaeon SW_5_70_135]